jgi:hypothetical protein
MYAGASKGQKKRYLYYRCDNKTCSRQPKSIRGKKVFDGIHALLHDGLQLKTKDYLIYRVHMVQLHDRKRQELAMKLHSKQGASKAVRRDLTEHSLAIVAYHKTSAIWKANHEKITQLEAQATDLARDIQRLKRQTRRIESNTISIERFLNLSQFAGSKLLAASSTAQDECADYCS